jgi:hypothetical protein
MGLPADLGGKRQAGDPAGTGVARQVVESAALRRSRGSVVRSCVPGLAGVARGAGTFDPVAMQTFHRYGVPCSATNRLHHDYAAFAMIR